MAKSISIEEVPLDRTPSFQTPQSFKDQLKAEDKKRKREEKQIHKRIQSQAVQQAPKVKKQAMSFGGTVTQAKPAEVKS